MFEGQENSLKQAVEVEDTQKDIFLKFLQFLYTDNAPVTADNFGNLMYCAKKYDIETLSSFCKRSLQSFIKPDLVCKMMEFAYQFDDSEIIDTCLKTIEVNTPSFLYTESFMKLCSTCVYKITQHDRIFAPEDVVYQQVCIWSEKECARQELPVTAENQRMVLGDILFEVRFPNMNHQFLDNIVCESNLLTDKDKIEILRRQLKSKTEKSCKFKYHERIWRSSKVKSSQFSSKIRMLNCKSGNTDFSLNFHVSSYSVLVGIYLNIEKLRQHNVQDVKVVGTISESNVRRNSSTVEFSIPFCQIEDNLMELYPNYFVPVKVQSKYTISIGFVFNSTFGEVCNGLDIEYKQIKQHETTAEFNGKELSLSRPHSFTEELETLKKFILITGLHLV
ncbi:BTB/POZ domain-containing protein 2-like [Saccostrea cucullata]|uniref:BTB/POZ domain-containing protein 2-like n=1 Tax=Saccostrea cuccullata TaxID=36930 RepID=UPI002ED567A5